MIGLKPSACTEVQEPCQRAQGAPVESSIPTDFACPSSANHRPVQHKPPNTPSSEQLQPTLARPSTRLLFHIPVADLAQYRTFAAPRRPEPSAPGTRCSGTEEPSLFISANPAKRGSILNAESRASRETHGNDPIVTSCWAGKHHPGLHSYHGGASRNTNCRIASMLLTEMGGQSRNDDSEITRVCCVFLCAAAEG